MTPRNMILEGDAVAVLKTLEASSVDCVVTSPPYWGIRDYKMTEALGVEDTVEEWVRRMRAVMAEVARVLVSTGSAWVNLGDGYSHGRRNGVPKKSLVLAPERLALALIEDGWLIRNRVTYAKTNAMPESVTDRLASTSEVMFFLTRNPHYTFDLDIIREPRLKPVPDDLPQSGLVQRNPGDVWFLSKAHYRGKHFSTFPETLITRPILATCPLQVCLVCQAPWQSGPGKTFLLGKRIPTERRGRIRRFNGSWQVVRQPGPVAPTCDCDGPTRPGLVLDPFMGSGTTGLVASQLGRDWLGIELNPDHVDLAWERLGRERPPNMNRAA